MRFARPSPLGCAKKIAAAGFLDIQIKLHSIHNAFILNYFFSPSLANRLPPAFFAPKLSLMAYCLLRAVPQL